MTKLYIGNTSRQHFIFTATEPETLKVIERTIRSGTQELVFEGAPEVIDAMINQHAIYGMKTAAEASRDKHFNGYCYKLDKPITIENFQIINEINYDALTEVGKQTRRNASLYGMATISGQDGLGGSGIEVEIEHADSNPEYSEIYSDAPPVAAQRRGRRK